MTPRDRFPALALGFAAMFSALAAQAAPPAEANVAQWSDQFRQIAAESGARITGQWVTARAPYARRPMIVCGVDHPAAKVWMRWAAKTSKTQVVLNATFHAIDTAPRSVMIVCPSLQKSIEFEREVFTPAANATPRVAAKIMGVRSRSGDGSTTRNKRFRGGFLKIATASSEKELQQSDIGLLVLEEPTSFPDDVGGRGSPIRQARGRTYAWGDDAKEIGGGTPGLKGACTVTAEVERGTQELYYLPCPHCGAWQVLVWENMTRFQGRPHITCAAADCGALIGHEHKREMLDASIGAHPELDSWVPCFESADAANPKPPLVIGSLDELHRWQARDIEGRYPSFDGIWQAYSPFSTWQRILTEYDEAAGSPEKLVTFTQQVLGREFESAYDRPASSKLMEIRDQAAKLAGVRRGRIPPWAWALIGDADVQGYGIVWNAWAVGPCPGGGLCYARIDTGLIGIPPVDPRAWAELSNVTRKVYEGEACAPIGFDRFGVDTGGHHTTQAYAWCAGRPNVMALKGKPNDRDALPLTLGKKVRAKVGGRVVATVPLYLVGTHKLKKDVYFGLTQMLAGVEAWQHLPGTITFDDQATEQDFREITAEVLLPPDPIKRRREEMWERSPAGAPNEQLDLAVYCLAMAWALLPDRMTADDWERFIAPRRRDPARDGALPLEELWSGDPVVASTAMPSPGALPAAAANPRPASGADAGGVLPAPASAPVNLASNSARDAIMAMARRNRSDV